jgi:molybdate/tungstate transport system permease protein
MLKNKINLLIAKPYLVLWFLSIFIIFFLIFPIIRIILSSDFQIFTSIFLDQSIISSIILTLECAFYATLFALISCIPLSYIICRYDFFGKTIIEAAINIPVIIPHSAAGIALLSVFSQEFFLGRLCHALNISIIDSKLGITLGMLFVSAPFLINGCIQAFNSYDEKLEKTARTLGASFWQTFFKISLPLAKRGILRGAIMMWARGISEFGAVVILAYHPMVAPILIYERFEAYGLKHSKPVAALLIIICLIIFTILTIIGNKHVSSKKYQ